jgi:hypothetical protein
MTLRIGVDLDGVLADMEGALSRHGVGAVRPGRDDCFICGALRGRHKCPDDVAAEATVAARARD